MSGRLSGKSVFVTGAGSGLGRATALLCAAEGGKVFCGGTTLETVMATVKAANQAGGTAAGQRLDVSDPQSVDDAVAAAEAEFGPVDALINIAGIAGAGDAVSTTFEFWERVIAVNLTGTWLMSRAVLKSMIERRRGSLVLMSSLGGMLGIPALASYSASKGGVIALMRQMACDYAARNIRVNAICPGSVPTPLVVQGYHNISDGDPDVMRAKMELGKLRYPMHRFGTEDEIAALALFLATDECGFLTGVAIPVDGAMSAVGWQPGH